MRITCETFEQFQDLASKFGEGKFDLLIVVGSAGLAKTRTMRAACKKDVAVIEGGNMSAFGFYWKLYEHRNDTIIIDDIDGLYNDTNAVRLLKGVCSTEKVKTVAWHTKTKLLPKDADGAPISEFTTESRVCIIANEWKTLNKNIQAVGDRGMLVQFEPSAHEVHLQVAKWFTDKAILAYFERHLDEIAEPSMRDYVQAKKLRDAGIGDWKIYLQQNWNKPIDPKLAIARLTKIAATENDKIRIFQKWTGLSRATYFREKKIAV